MPKTITEKEHDRLVREFHIRLRRYGIDDENKKVILESFGVESSKDLNIAQLIDLCDLLDKAHNKGRQDLVQLDRFRKYVLGAIGSYLRTTIPDKSNDINYIKNIACRAAQCERFNDIPMTSLQAIYGSFSKQTKSWRNTQNLTKEMIDYVAYMN
jgi:hypothetical protein